MSEIEVSGKEVEFEVQRHDKEALDIDVTRCCFAEFFRALGQPELGALLIWETDFDIASVGEREVSLDPDRTGEVANAAPINQAVGCHGFASLCSPADGSRVLE